ncbi:hypothetical protein O6H91_07G111700 [Diphasiastrum complanatum]|uniref:Uncharacterized protein n=1 Tax=Diphasiastrum complanatum TaxID=34168 RepID=A0ACC2D8X8_DIPCM|nr:hypothetical protein O6H91_07G111700 [Diphasiastrum complanatum]
MASSPTHSHPYTQHSGNLCDLGNGGISLCRLGSVDRGGECNRATTVVHVFIQRFGFSAAQSRLPWKLRCEAVKYDSAKVSLIELVHQKRRQQQQEVGGKRSPSALEFDDPSPNLESAFLRREEEITEQSSLEIAVDQGQVAYELEEAKVLLSEYLKKEHMVAHVPLIVSKAMRFLIHLVSLMHAQHQIRYLSRRELTTTEIRSTLLSFLKSSGAEQGSRFIDYILSFPAAPPPQNELTDLPISIEKNNDKAVKKKQKPELQEHLDYTLFPSLVYLNSLGMTQEQLATIQRRCPQIVRYKVEEDMKPVISFCLSLGVPPSEIPGMVLKRPQLLKCNVITNLKHKINHLQALGVETKSFPKILVYFPHMLTYSQKKVSAVVNFLLELGLSSSEAGAVLVRFPHIVGYSITLKLKPVATYFSTIGIDRVSAIIIRSPQTLGLSLEDNIKPTVKFFLSIGFSNEEIAIIINRFPQILGLNLNKNLRKKWEFFCQMDCPRSEIVKFPQYFGYDLQKRIIPRYEILAANNLKWGVNRLLSNPESLFLKMVKKAVVDAHKIMNKKKISTSKRTSIVNQLILEEAL